MSNLGLRGKVVVVTGASSGIGRAAAIRFGREGARVVLAARRKDDLDETARLCREAGGEALVVVTDVTREADVQNLVRESLAAFGRIDVWVNNAGVTLFALLAEAPFEQHQRVIETNVFGPMFGARAVVPLFKEQGHGVMINVGSVLSKVGQPFVPSYVISKFALRGLTEALRPECAEYPDIHICGFYPYAVDTPHFQEGANERGRKARAMPPTQSPEKVADALVALAARPRRERHVPRSAVLGLALHWLMPRTTERLLLRALSRWHFDDRSEPVTDGNLRAPSDEKGRVHGRRSPRLSAPMFFAWVFQELVRMQVERVLPRGRTRRTPKGPPPELAAHQA